MEPLIKIFNFIKLILPYIFVMVIGYFLTAFIVLELNPLKWDLGTRAGFVVFFGILQVIGTAAYIDITRNRQ